MLSTQWRTCTPLFCWMTIGLIGGPWLVNANGDFSCYSGSVNIQNGELNVASTKSIVSQQCSPPPTSQPSSPTPEVSSTAQPATSIQTTLSTTPLNQTTPLSTLGIPSASPEAPSVNNSKPAVSSETPTTPSPPTGASAPTTAAPSPSTPTPGLSSGTTNGSTTAIPSAENTTPARKRRAAGSNVTGCVVTKSNQTDFRDNMTATFSCPTPDSPCTNINFNGSTGTKDQTQCCVGALCNTLDSFIMRENFNYSKVGSCFVGNTTDAVPTQCGDSSNMCLTITDSDNATGYYCGNDTLQSYCQLDGALREGSFKQVENITVRCCGSVNCNTPFPPSTPTPSSMATNMSTAAPASTATPPSTATPSSSNATNESSSTPPSTATPSNTATPSSSNTMNESTATPASTGAPQTTSGALATAGHSNKTLIIGICVAFAVGLLGGIIITVICCRRKGSTAARPGELLAFDSFHYKRMGADEVNEEVFMS